MIEPRILMLLAVRLRSRAVEFEVAETFVGLGGDPGDANSLLAAAKSLEQIRVRGEESRWSLTGAGHAELAAYLLAESKQVGRADLGTAYEAFLPLNRAFLALLATDAPLAEAGELVRQLSPILDALEGQLARFGFYRIRFAQALLQADDDATWISSPSVDSIHTIWFELHEHLLATLGRDRTQEGSQQ